MTPMVASMRRRATTPPMQVWTTVHVSMTTHLGCVVVTVPRMRTWMGFVTMKTIVWGRLKSATSSVAWTSMHAITTKTPLWTALASRVMPVVQRRRGMQLRRRGLPWTANGDLCVYIAEGDCDCDGNQLDATGECGGGCAADDDQDGVCDDVDGCIGVVDACGNGPGAIYDCGCFAIPEGQCDCDGTQVDVAGGVRATVPWTPTGTVGVTNASRPSRDTLETEVVTVHTTGSLAGLTTTDCT